LFKKDDLFYEWNYAKSEKLFKKATELNPNYVGAHSWYAQLLSLQGRDEQALRQMRRAEKLSLQSPALLVSYLLTLRNARKFDESLDKIRLPSLFHFHLILFRFSMRVNK